MSAQTMTRPVLDERLAAAQDDLLAAQRALGEVELDGGDRAAAATAVVEARANVDGLVAAVEAFEEREQAAKEERFRLHNVEDRLRVLDWMTAYLERARVVLELRPQMEAAEKQLMALAGVRAVLFSPTDSVTGKGISPGDWMHASRKHFPGLDEIPEVSVAQEIVESTRRRGQVAGLTVRRCDELLERVAELRATATEEIDR